MAKESGRTELSIDPNQKTLLRIFCKSIDNAVEYKSMEFCKKTTVQEVIVKMIELLRLDNQISEFVLCETIGRCMQLSDRGSIRRKIAKPGQPFVFIEQNRRVLLNLDLILNILTFWTPSYMFSRRLELCYANTKCQMSASQISFDEVDTDTKSIPISSNTNGSVSSNSDVLPGESYDKETQTENITGNNRSTHTKHPSLLVLKGDFKTLLIQLDDDCTEFGGPGSRAKVGLKRLQDFGDWIVFSLSKESSPDKSKLRIVIDNVYNPIDLPITINGAQAANKSILFPGDIINIGDFYSFFFKVDSSISGNLGNDYNINIQSNNEQSDQSSVITKSNSIASSNDVDGNSNGTKRLPIQQLGKNSTIINVVTLDHFDRALAQIMLHYIKDEMKLQYAVVFTFYLIKFCRESQRCTLSVETIQDQITKRFCRTIEEAFKDDNYLLATIKLTALGLQVWMIFNHGKHLQSTEENRLWLNHFECFTVESFGHISKYICEKAKNMSLCFFLENPFADTDISEQSTAEEQFYTMGNLLDFLAGVYGRITKIHCSKTSDIFKGVLTSHVIICLTESIVSRVLSDMNTFTWNKGVFISAQVDKFENWLDEQDQFNNYDRDGFLRDFSKLISTKLEVLKNIDWRQLRQNYKNIPPTILRQFLLAMISTDERPPIRWLPPQEEMYDCNQNVNEVLSQYLQSQEQHILFQPSIILQNESIPLNEVVRSPDFISTCKVMDSELLSLKVNFQWKELVWPQSISNFKIKGHLQSSYLSNGDKPISFVTSNSFSKKKLSIVKKLTKKRIDAGNEIPVAGRPQLVKYGSTNGLNNLSKSLASINYAGLRPKVLTSYNPSSTTSTQNNSFLQVNNSKYSFSSGGNVFSPIDKVNQDLDSPGINRSIRSTRNISNSVNHLNHHFQHLAGQSGRYSDVSSDIDNRARMESNNSDVFPAEVVSRMEVTIKKSPEESYGITITDGMCIDQKKDGIFIFKVTKDSPAYLSQNLEPGDELLAINNYPVRGLNFTECLILMKKSLSELKLLIRKSKPRTESQVIDISQ